MRKKKIKKTNSDYGYRPITVLFDPRLIEEKQMLDWLDQNKKKNNGYGAQMKKALLEMIEREENKIRMP